MLSPHSGIPSAHRHRRQPSLCMTSVFPRRTRSIVSCLRQSVMVCQPQQACIWASFWWLSIPHLVVQVNYLVLVSGRCSLATCKRQVVLLARVLVKKIQYPIHMAQWRLWLCLAPSPHSDITVIQWRGRRWSLVVKPGPSLGYLALSFFSRRQHTALRCICEERHLPPCHEDQHFEPFFR